MKFWFLECKKRTGHMIKLPSRDSIYMKGMDLADIAVAIPVVTEKENLPKRWQDRLERFAPGGVPKHVRLYDNGGESADRYTCCFKALKLGFFPYLTMSSYPFSPQGVGLHGEHNQPIDVPRYSHLGKKIKWDDLPHDVKCCIWQDYCDYWDIPTPVEYLYGYKGDK